MMLKKEIIKIYNNNDNNNNEENNTFLIDNEQIIVDMVKLKKVFSQSKKLMLEIVSCDTSEKIITLEINPYGYINSKRKKKDGITYFGYDVGQRELQVDFALKNNDNYYYDDAFNGRHFMIKFNPDDLNYYIKDLGRGLGTFVKIQEWTELKNNFLLNIGENYIVFFLGEEDDDEEDEKIKDIDNNKEENSLNIKIFSVNTQHKIYKLLPSNCPVTIGRSSENYIFIDDDMLSRIHCTIDFNNEKWYIQDGFAKNGFKDKEIKKSTNGSWIYAYDEIPIVNKTIFKANHNLFLCDLV